MKRLFFILILLPSLAFSQSGGVGFWTSASSAPPPPVQTVTNYMPVGDLEVVPIFAPGATYPYNFYVADYVRSVIIQYTGDAVVPKNGTVVAGVLDNPGVGGPYLKNPTKIKKMSYSNPGSGVFFVLHDDNKRVSRFDLGTNNMTDVAVSDYIHDFAPDPTNPSVVYTVEYNDYVNEEPVQYDTRYRYLLKLSKYSGGIRADMGVVLNYVLEEQEVTGGPYFLPPINSPIAAQSVDVDYMYGSIVVSHMIAYQEEGLETFQRIFNSVSSYSPTMSNPTGPANIGQNPFNNPPPGAEPLFWTFLSPTAHEMPIAYFSLPYTDIDNQVPVYIVTDPYRRTVTTVVTGDMDMVRPLALPTYRIGAVPNYPSPLSAAVPTFFIDTFNRVLYRNYTHLTENTTHTVSTGLSSSPLWN